MITCKQCSKSYSHFATLKTHILEKHASVDKTITKGREQATKTKVKNVKIGRPKLNKCAQCGETFTTCYSLARHLNGRCKQPPGMLSNIQLDHISSGKSNIHNIIIDAYKRGLNENNMNNTSHKSGNIQEGGSHNSMVINTDNHTENNITQNNALYLREVHINPIGKENLSHISDATILQILNQGVNAVPALAKAIMELPENCNIVESDKRNRKATVVNRNGDVEVMDLSKALTMSATETVDKVDDYYEKFKDELPKNNKSIQRMARAHGLDSDEDSGDEIPKGETYDDYFKKYMSQIKDNIEVNKKPILERLNKYKEHNYKSRSASNAKSQPELI